MLGVVWLLFSVAAYALRDETSPKCYSTLDYEEKLQMKLEKIEYQTELYVSKRADRKTEFEDDIERFMKRSADERKLQQNITAMMGDDLNLEKIERMEVFENERSECARRNTEEIQKHENVSTERFKMKEEQRTLFETQIQKLRKTWDLEIQTLQELNSRLRESVASKETNRLQNFEVEMEEFKMKHAREIEKQLNLPVDLQGNDALLNFLRTPVVTFNVMDPKDGPTSGSVTFSNEIINNGGGYDTETGRFTSPVGGIYHFDLHLVIKSDRSRFHINCSIEKNGLETARIHIYASIDDSISEAYNSLYLRLGIDDIVTTACYTNYYEMFWGNVQLEGVPRSIEDWSSFSGYLVRPNSLNMP